MYTHMNIYSYDMVQLYCMQFNFMSTACKGYSFKLWLDITKNYYTMSRIRDIMSVTKDDKCLS